MFVSNFMSSPVKTVTPETFLPAAREIMTTGSFRHLPVVGDKNRLLGIITDRDLRSALPSPLMSEPERGEYLQRFATLTVGQIMTAIVTKLPVKATLDDALILFEERKVGALPVVNGANQLVGILAVNDLLKAYKQLFGLGVRGSSLLVVKDDGNPRALTRLTEVLETKRVPFTRLIRTGGTGQNDEESLIYVRVHTYNLSGIHQALTEAGFQTVVPAAKDLAT
jgi:acetoin utilization protein AcuB